MNIAFLGMGLMGSRMSRRLLEAGHPLWVWNRTPAACTPLIEMGAQPLSSWADLAQVDVIALCLSDDQAVCAVVDQLMDHLHAGQTVVDFSSLSLATTQQLAAQLAMREVTWIDAPVSGGVMGAEQGSLVIFAGGDAGVIAQLTPLFAPLSQRVTRMGDVGAGQVTKICNQLIVAASSNLIAEAVALAQHAGVDATLLAPALAGGFADSKPFAILAPRMSSACFEPVQWRVKTLAKDLGNALDLAAHYPIDLRVAQAAHQRLCEHAEQAADQDLSTLILAIEST